MILVGDIGGSNTRLAIATRENGSIALKQRHAYPNATAASLSALIDRHLGDGPRPDQACLAVAGPTDGRVSSLTNLAWHLDAEALGRQFGFPFRLINDFEAVAWGLDDPTEANGVELQAGTRQPSSPRLAIGPGTGLGVALSVPTPAGHRPLPGEGGHIGFAPVDGEQAALLHHLQARHGRVSVERILSGPGIAELFAFCRAASGRPINRPRTPAEVTEAALNDSDPIARWAMKLFCRILGQTAGDLALAADARGGVYLAGGIPPRILPLLQDGEFIAGFRNKGRFSDWAATVPVSVVTDPDIGLKGAAVAARA